MSLLLYSSSTFL